MRVLLLCNKKKDTDYVNFAFQLLIQLFAEQNYLIQEANTFPEANRLAKNNKNTVCILRSGTERLNFFYKIKLYFFVKKQKINYLVQAAYAAIYSSHLPQLIIPFDTENLTTKSKQSASLSYTVCSEIAKQRMINRYQLKDNKIQVVSAVADDFFKSISWSEQQAIKMEYTQGREFFLLTNEDKTNASFMSLLKAFSAFKKWQQSSMKLVVACAFLSVSNNEWKEKTSTYKYRQDVVFLDQLTAEKYATITACAYAFIHTPGQDNDVVPVLQAMQCGTPCISFTTESIKEYGEDAVVLIEPNNYELLSEKMILIYKDETLRSKLIQKGKKRAQYYTKQKAMSALSKAISSEVH